MNEFIQNLEEAIGKDALADISLNSNSPLSGEDYWDSLSVMQTTEMINLKYDAYIMPVLIKSCGTVQDLFNLIQQAKGNN